MISAQHFNRWGRAAFIVLTMGVAAGPARSDGSTSVEQQQRPQVEDLAAQRRDMENDPDLYLRLIGQMQDKGLYFASLAHLDAFDRRWPDNPRSVLMRADALRETAYFDQATVLYKGLLDGPLSAGANHGLGLIASKKGEMAAALHALSRATQMDPTNATMLNDLGYIQIMSGQLAEAGFNLHKATELDPKNARAGANLALYYLIENKPARAGQIMSWYRLPDDRRKEIIEQAREFKKQPPTIEEIVQK